MHVRQTGLKVTHQGSPQNPAIRSTLAPGTVT